VTEAIGPKKIQSKHQMEVSGILEKLGWERGGRLKIPRAREGYIRIWRPTSNSTSPTKFEEVGISESIAA